MTCQGHRQ